MNIYIKSFNRPYFLDRCINSIYEKVKNFDKIIVLDDGTPEKYLKKIAAKYPDIIIRISEFYQTKSEMIEEREISKSKLTFPGNFWYRELKTESGKRFMLLEDDMYLIAGVDLSEINNFMDNYNLSLFKLFWHGSEQLIQGKTKSENNFKIQYPRWEVSLNKFKLLRNDGSLTRRILRRFRLDKNLYRRFFLKYYTIYGVAGGIYTKDYFIHIWEQSAGLDEYLQIEKSLEYYKITNSQLRIGRPQAEMAKTSFSSSATNEFDDIDFSIFEFNFFLNEAWFSEKLTVSDMLPDIEKKKIEEITGIDNAEQWLKWKERFSRFYKNIGCVID